MAWRKKSRKEVITALSREDVEKIEEEVADLVKTQLPIGRVKKVVRMNPDVEMVNSEALQLLAKAAELFIKELSNASNQYACQEKRKTVQTKDIDKAIQKNWQFAFLEDALDGWPKSEPKKRQKGGTSSQETIHEQDVEENEENEEENEEELPETVPEADEDEELVENDTDVVENRRDVFAEQF
uniref:CBFD_NFYB_HMF domain-containing protein n=1 Tax=Caenorhabditis japonica TaxID=281687 RepID=A0A8R1DIY4_CAEJA